MAREKHEGNTVGATAEFQAECMDKVGRLMRFDRLYVSHVKEGQRLVDIRLKAPPPGGSEWMVIVKMETAEGRFVTFVTGSGLMGALSVAIEKVMNGTAKWKEDQYAGGGD